MQCLYAYVYTQADVGEEATECGFRLVLERLCPCVYIFTCIYIMFIYMYTLTGRRWRRGDRVWVRISSGASVSADDTAACVGAAQDLSARSIACLSRPEAAAPCCANFGVIACDLTRACAAVCSSVLQSVVVCCDFVQCVAVCCIVQYVLQYVAACAEFGHHRKRGVERGVLMMTFV